MKCFGLTGPLIAIALISGIVSPGVSGDQEPSELGIIAIKPTPEWVKARIEEKERLIAAEPSLEGLPQRLSYELRTLWPDYQVLRREKADPESLRWVEERHGQDSPYVCLGDFDGDGLEDAAVIVIDRDTEELKIIAFHQVRVSRNPGGFEDRSYLPIEVMAPRPMPAKDTIGHLAVLCQPPGDHESVEGGVTLRLKAHSLVVGWSLFYFLDGQYQAMVIAD